MTDDPRAEFSWRERALISEALAEELIRATARLTAAVEEALSILDPVAVGDHAGYQVNRAFRVLRAAADQVGI